MATGYLSTMSDTILLLQLEHRHADRLLNLIEQQVDLGSQCDLEVLGDIAAYFLDYPDLCHHPIEDSVFRHLQAKDPAAATGLEPLLEEHEYISELGRSFAKMVNDAQQNSAPPNEPFMEEAAYFAKRYRQHMHSEEQEFFPLAQRTLDHEDWAQIEFDLFDRKDPLYDNATESRFRALRARIESHVGPSMDRAAALHSARELHQINDISAFNERMSATGRDYCLVPRDNGGYSLNRNDQTVIDIPPCSEARAAWCAWFFLQHDAH